MKISPFFRNLTIMRKGGKKCIKACGILKYKLRRAEIHRGIGYESGNTGVAAVSGDGLITAKARGVCYVYAYAQNGVYKRIRVIVI